MFLESLLTSVTIGQVVPESKMSFVVFPIVGLILLLAIGLVAWCAIKPDAARVLTRIFAVAALGIGGGVLTWGICAAALGEPMRSPFGLFVTGPSEAIGCGAGCLAAGVTALVLSFVGGRKNRTPRD